MKPTLFSDARDPHYSNLLNFMQT